MLRDHRINQIGEGANEVLLSFIGLVGMRGPGMQMKGVAEALKRPWQSPATIGRFITHALRRRWARPQMPIHSQALWDDADRLGKLIRRLGVVVFRTLLRYRESILDRQLVLERIAWLAMEIFASACALSRWDDELQRGNHDNDAVARLFIADSLRRAETQLNDLKSNDDALIKAVAAPGGPHH
jgi:hypothetical protein